MNFFSRQPIRRQVILAAFALTLPVFIAIAWSANRSRLERLDEAEAEAGRLAVTTGAYLDRYLAHLDTISSAMGLHTPVAALDAVETERMLSGVLDRQPLLLNVSLVDAEGTVIASARPLGNAGQALRQYSMQVVSTGARVVGDVSVDAPKGKPSVIFSYPVRSRDGAIVGALAMTVNLGELQAAFDQLPLPEGAVVAVLDHNNRFLMRSRDAEKYVGTVGPAFARESVPGTAQDSGADGVDRYYGIAALNRAPWTLTLGVPHSVVMARVRPLWRRNAIIAAAVVGSSFFLSLWLATVLSTGLNDLRAVTRRIAGGDLSPVAKTGAPNREFAELQDAFMAMARSLRETQDAVTQQVLQERRMKEALQSLQSQVVRQERLAAVGALASGIAHELNNPLQAIQGSAELLERQSSNADTRAELTFIKAQCRRAGEVVRSLSRFSSQPVGPPSVVDLREVVAEALKLCARNDRRPGTTMTVNATTTRRVFANVAELEQVTLSLLINAEQALERSNVNDGRIEVNILDAGDNVRLEVYDNGPGVSAEDEPKLFQPFFTRKPVGQGTGLGLSVSYGIIRALGGTIGYARNDRGGATFYFELPADLQEPESIHDAAAILRRPV